MAMNDAFNIVLGILSVLAIVAGFLIEQYQLIFWILGGFLLVYVTIGYLVIQNILDIKKIKSKLIHIEEHLNIYERLSKLEAKINMKKGQVNIIEIIKWVIAIILLIALFQALKNLF